MTLSKTKLPFQAEVAQLLHLVTHSLYSNKEIFLRELISNASDACDKLRFEAIDQSALYEDQPTLDVRVSFDKEAKTITIADNGIGLSQQEAIDHLGTIAKSGTREFMSKLGRPEGRCPAHRAVRRGLLLGLHRGRQDHGRVAPRGPARRGRRALGQRRRWRFRSRHHRASTARHQRDAASARGCRGIPEPVEAQVHHLQVLRPHLAAHPDGEGGMEGG